MYKVLIVEDDLGIRETVADLFELNGYQVFLAKDGAEGFRKIKTKRPDVVISDIMMPIMNGLQLLAKVRGQNDTQLLPFIFITAKVMTESKLKGLELGADDYLTKPFVIKELFLKVNNLIKRRKRTLEVLSTKPEKVQGVTRDESIIQGLRIFLDENISNAHLSLDDIAKSLAISSSTLQKKVKKTTKKSVSQFIREYRLKRARDLILLSNESLKQIAHLTGFGSQSYFSICYKEFFGHSPSADF